MKGPGDGPGRVWTLAMLWLSRVPVELVNNQADATVGPDVGLDGRILVQAAEWVPYVRQGFALEVVEFVLNFAVGQGLDRTRA